MNVFILCWKVDLEFFIDVGVFFRDLFFIIVIEGIFLGFLRENVVGFRDGESDFLDL